MPHDTIDIRTEDGTCPTHIFTPAAAHNELPTVLLFMDGLGIRPAMFEIGQRLADGGYYVVLPDLYYRSGFTKGANLFRDDAIRAEWTKTVLPTVSIGNIMRDVPSLLAHLDAQPNVRSEQIGNGGEALADVVRAPRGKTEELGFSRRGRKREARTNAGQLRKATNADRSVRSTAARRNEPGRSFFVTTSGCFGAQVSKGVPFPKNSSGLVAFGVGLAEEKSA